MSGRGEPPDVEGTKVRYITATAIFLFGMSTIGTESVKWMAAVGPVHPAAYIANLYNDYLLDNSLIRDGNAVTSDQRKQDISR